MLDKFNTSTFAQEVVSATGSRVIERQYSPRVAILGSQTFSQEGHSTDNPVVKIADEPSNTVVKQMERMEEQAALGFELLHRFKQESTQLRNEIDQLLTSLVEKVEESTRSINEEIYGDYKQLKDNIRQQRFDREQLLKQIDYLKRESEVQRQKSEFIEARIAEMELQVGMIANTKTYQENFDLGNEKVDLAQLAESFRP